MSHSAIVGGQVADGAGATFQVIDPASEELLAQIGEADDALVDLAVTSARASFADRRWRGLDLETRQAALRRRGFERGPE